MANEIIGELNIKNTKIAIVIARFNAFIGNELLAGAKDGLIRHGVDEKDITVVHVPGALEIPLTVKALAKTGKFSAIIALGIVIRGATTHYEQVSNFAVQSTAAIALETDTPVMNGILTVETIEQAIERAGTKAGNKGFDCAMGAIEMINILKKIKALK